MVRLSYLWEKLSSSYWFVPTCMLAASVVLSAVTISFDHRTEGRGIVTGFAWFHAIGPSGGRAVLSVVASSMITVAGVVFSITVVVLTLASSQYGPRVLRNFFRDRTTSVVFGTFVSTFLYCLLVLRVVDDDADAHVPYTSISVAMVFALASLLLLIYFIHHISTAIQASSVVIGAHGELMTSLERSFPSGTMSGDPESSAERDAPPGDAQSLTALESGYVLRVDEQGVVDFAESHAVVVHVVTRPGQFTVRGADLAKVESDQPLSDESLRELRGFFLVGPERTPYQDVLFAVRQLVEIAVRSLSPGVNDPFTAMQCIDYLEPALCEAATRSALPTRRVDADGNVRLTAQPIRFHELADAAWSDIRHHGCGDPAVVLRLFDAMRTVAGRVTDESHRSTVRRHAESLMEDGRRAIENSVDRADIEEAFRDVLESLSLPASSVDAASELWRERGVDVESPA